jgi:YD repeat-containing protein
LRPRPSCIPSKPPDPARHRPAQRSQPPRLTAHSERTLGSSNNKFVELVDADGTVHRFVGTTQTDGSTRHGKVQRITDHDGSALDFDYYDDGNLLRLTQRGGTTANGPAAPDRSFVFTYTTSAGDSPAISDPALRVNPDPRTPNQSPRIYSVRDPRGHETTFTYYAPSNGDQLRWKLKTRTNRNSQQATFGYDLVNRVTNPLNQATQVEWTPDFKVSKVTEPSGKFSTYTCNANGYLTSTTNQTRNETTQLTYIDSPVDAALGTPRA